MKKLINYDWVECFGYLSTSCDYDDFSNSTLFSKKYRFEKQQYSGRNYSVKYKVYNGADMYVYDLYVKPYSPVMKAESCTIRCSNEECYNKELFYDLRCFMSDIGFSFRNFSRLDICHDSNSLKNGLTHDALMRSFLANRYLLQRNLSFQLHGSQKQNSIDGMSITFIKKEKKKKEDQEEGVKVEEGTELSGMKWGSQNSAVGIKIYNKTREMIDVKQKTYIINSWADNGLDIKKDIWRIELSLRADAMKWIDEEWGELITLDLDSDLVTKKCAELFYSVAKKYFTFKVNDGTANKTRMNDLSIFDYDTEFRQIKRYREEHSTKSNKMDKYICKRLEQESQDYKSYDTEQRHAIEQVHALLRKKYNVPDKVYNATIYEYAEQEKKIARWQYELIKQKRLLIDKVYSNEEYDYFLPPLPSLSLGRKASVQ